MLPYLAMAKKFLIIREATANKKRSSLQKKSGKEIKDVQAPKFIAAAIPYPCASETW